MGNTKNLRPIALSHEEATKNGRLGGVASGVKRRQKKQLRELTLDVLMQDAIRPYQEIIKKLCPELTDHSNLTALVLSMFNIALYGRGDDAVLAARTLMQWAGFAPELEAAEGASAVTGEKETQIIFYSASERENPLRKEEKNEEK